MSPLSKSAGRIQLNGNTNVNMLELWEFIIIEELNGEFILPQLLSLTFPVIPFHRVTLKIYYMEHHAAPF